MFLKTFNKYIVGSIDKIDEVLDKIDDIFWEFIDHLILRYKK